ncbi:hypothetical protein Rhe02_73230 [Rhizocola hellebori]|uniref:Uncharacterized protein n=1 Tax=Rhizocola hellebori TaxID=1392758 RepID=A0A8J3QEH8_9ACTN|nr:hypothetical protein [Rhizocola hellebori]GIH09256.1 hypothetical protein Rhe02_73230 [Rhizocola hellebori]
MLGFALFSPALADDGAEAEADLAAMPPAPPPGATVAPELHDADNPTLGCATARPSSSSRWISYPTGRTAHETK